MFKRRQKAETGDVETLIGAGTRIEGNVEVSAGVHLEGYVKGNVTAASGGEPVLSIAEKGTVEGLVEVPRVVVHGEVKGDIHARDKVELGATARISGNVVYGTIEMAAGAIIHGRLMALTGGEAKEVGVAGAAAPAAAGSGTPD